MRRWASRAGQPRPSPRPRGDGRRCLRGRGRLSPPPPVRAGGGGRGAAALPAGPAPLPLPSGAGGGRRSARQRSARRRPSGPGQPPGERAAAAARAGGCCSKLRRYDASSCCRASVFLVPSFFSSPLFHGCPSSFPAGRTGCWCRVAFSLPWQGGKCVYHCYSSWSSKVQLQVPPRSASANAALLRDAIAQQNPFDAFPVCLRMLFQLDQTF